MIFRIFFYAVSFVFLFNLNPKNLFSGNMPAPTKMSDSTRWIGFHAHKKINGIELTDVAEIKQKTKILLGAKEYENFMKVWKYGPHMPVQEIDGWVEFEGCQKHNCGHIYYFLIRPKDSTLLICESLDTPSVEPFAAKAKWFGSKRRILVSGQRCNSLDDEVMSDDWNAIIAKVWDKIES